MTLTLRPSQLCLAAVLLALAAPGARAAEAPPATAPATAPAATSPAPEALTTLFKPRRSAYSARPAYGCKIPLHWSVVPLPKLVPVVIDVVDDQGQKVAAQECWPAPDTTKWSGDVQHDYWLCLPKYRIKGKVTGEGIPEGKYTLWVHIGRDDAHGVSQPIAVGPGLNVDARNHILIGTLTIDANAPLPDLGPKTLDLTGYRLTFHDDFEALSVSAKGPCGEGPGLTRWMAHTPYWGDFGDAHFVDPTPDFPFTVNDGVLTIQVRKTDQGWQGGLLSSADPQGQGFAQKFGYFEMRAQLPKGPGTWPAFWLVSVTNLRDKADKTTGAEIDVLEQYGHSPNKLCTTTNLWHINGNPKGHDFTAEAFPVVGMTDGFHNYGVLITEERLTYYYDGV